MISGVVIYSLKLDQRGEQSSDFGTNWFSISQDKSQEMYFQHYHEKAKVLFIRQFDGHRFAEKYT